MSSTLSFIYELKDGLNGVGRPKIVEVVIDVIEKEPTLFSIESRRN